jgi:hypothetical protein
LQSLLEANLLKSLVVLPGRELRKRRAEVSMSRFLQEGQFDGVSSVYSVTAV